MPTLVLSVAPAGQSRQFPPPLVSVQLGRNWCVMGALALQGFVFPLAPCAQS